jgi:cytochrome P450
MADSRPFYAEDDISTFVFDIIWSITFGCSADTTKSKAAAVAQTNNMRGITSKDTMAVFKKVEEPYHYTALMRLLKGIEDDVVSPTPQLNHRLTRMNPSWRRARAHMEAVIQASLSGAATRFSAVHINDRKLDCATAGMVIRHQQNCQRDGHDVALDPQMAADEVIGYLVGGYDTTSAVVMWGLKLLADNPKAQTEFRSVLQTSFPSHTAGGTIPGATQLATAAHPLIDATVEEILRCATPLHGTSRKATVDTQILGYHVPKGTDVFFMINGPGYLMPDEIGHSIRESDRSASSRESKGRISEWDYNDIKSFRPERWLKKTTGDEMAFDPYAGPTRPFGGGPRGCFGKKLVSIETLIGISRTSVDGLIGICGASDHLQHAGVVL